MDPFLWIDGQRSAQSKFIEKPFLEIIKKFETVIEIGTFTGVFTKWISMNVNDKCRIFSYDNNPSYRIVGDLHNVNFRIADFFDLETLGEIKSLISTSGRTLILCDGGDKETEFKIISRFMKDNDVIMLHDYESDPVEYLAISESIGWLTNAESSYSSLRRYLPDLELIPYRYDEFTEVLWGSFVKKLFNSPKSIGLSITTSNRLDLFRTTIDSLSERCRDKEQIKYILHFDDSSTASDRLEMERLMKIKFPGSQIYNFYFERDSIKDPRRHMEIMKIWKSEIEDMCDFILHTEDDWRFDSDFYVSRIADFIENREEVAYVGISQELREFPEEITPTIDGEFWKWHFDKDKEILENLFLDTKIMKKSGDPNFWCYFINWPYFGFRPGVWDTKKISEFDFENISNLTGSFEINFASTIAEKYISYCLIDSVCEHIGVDNSAYDLNKSER